MAWAINTLQHWADVAEGFAEVRRVLNPGGRFFLADEEAVEGKCGAHPEGPLSDPDFVARSLEAAGFTDVLVSKHAREGAKMFLFASRRPLARGL